MKRLFLLLAQSLLLLALLVFVFPLGPSRDARAQTLTVDFFDVGKADAALITTPHGSRILIDAATNKEGKALAKRLVQAGIERIDVMIITHYDKDHVGGADQILEELSVGQVIMPVYEKESKQYSQFLDALAESPQTQTVPMNARSERSFTLDGAALRITAAHQTDYGKDEENDFSLAVRMTYGKTRFLFPGDAEDARQRELLLEGDVACDVLKAPYHGRLVAASQDFLTAASPQIAFIPDSDEDAASETVVSILSALGCRVHSARDGDLRVTSDGESVW
ncbi:MAG: MBL fold metallo-hydrolase [Clostridia bacterium]|nr:MBL fold metallo-hydrolase [Clostridia bacterium]